MADSVVYTITVLDISLDDRPPYQRTPGIFTEFIEAYVAVKENESDISESGTNRYAVIEKTYLNQILPLVERRMWFEWDATEEEYIQVDAPPQFARVVSFGIG